MANKYEVSRRILVRKLGLKASELVTGLVSGPCKTRTAVEQAVTLSTAAEALARLSARLVKLDRDAAATGGAETDSE
jgi:hypothetical protein